MSEKKMSRTPLLLSAFVYPGAGQFVQRRIGVALFFISSFTASFVWLIIGVLSPLLHTLQAALNFAAGEGNEAFQGISKVSVLSAFSLCLVLYVACLFDATRGAPRKNTPPPLP